MVGITNPRDTPKGDDRSMIAVARALPFLFELSSATLLKAFLRKGYPTEASN